MWLQPEVPSTSLTPSAGLLYRRCAIHSMHACCTHADVHGTCMALCVGAACPANCFLHVSSITSKLHTIHCIMVSTLMLSSCADENT